MLEKFVPEALQACIHGETVFRKALPSNLLSNVGVSVDAKEPEVLLIFSRTASLLSTCRLESVTVRHFANA